MGGKITESYKKQTDAVKKQKATLGLAEAEKLRLSALEAIEMALGRHLNHKLDFSLTLLKDLKRWPNPKKKCLNKCKI